MHMSREVLEEEHGRGMPALGSCERTLAGPTRAAPCLSCSGQWVASVTQILVICRAFLSCQAMVLLFFSLSFSTQAIHESVMPAGLLHYLDSRQSSLDTSSYQNASCGISVGCLINTANANDKLGGDIEPELCMGIFQPKKITLTSEWFYVLSPYYSYWEMISESATRSRKEEV